MRGTTAAFLIGLSVPFPALSAAADVKGAHTAVERGHELNDPLIQTFENASIDWRRGVVAVEAGTAADLRTPSAAAARSGAEKRAKETARARLVTLLKVLALHGSRHLDPAEIDRALGRAKVISSEAQSNGGVVLGMELSFGDWTPASPLSANTASAPDANAAASPEVALSVTECRLQAAPLVVVGNRPIETQAARYRPATSLPTGTRAIAAHLDAEGRIVVDDKIEVRQIVGHTVVVYFQRLVK